MSEPSTSDARTPTVLERAIARGQEGLISAETVLWVLAAGPVVILSDSAVAPASFPDAPLVVTRDDSRFLALFTHQDRAEPFLDGREPVAISAIELLRRVPADVGVVVNPGDAVGLEIPADGLRGFLQVLLSTRL